MTAVRCSNVREGENEVTEITKEVVKKGAGKVVNCAYSSRVFLLYSMKKGNSLLEKRDRFEDYSDEWTRETTKFWHQRDK